MRNKENFHLKSYSRGAFLNVTSGDLDSISKDLQCLKGLKSRGHIELWLEHFPESQRSLDELADLIGSERVILHGPFLGLSLVSHVPAIRQASLERLRMAARIARTLRAHVMTVHMGQLPVFASEATRREGLKKAIEELSTIHDVRITIENMPCRSGASRESVTSLQNMLEVSRLAPSIGMTLDVGHAIQSGEDWSGFLIDHASEIDAIHLHDGYRNGPAHLPLGDGELDIGAFVRACRLGAFSGFVTLETLGWRDTYASWTAWDQAIGVDERPGNPQISSGTK
jgi:sugar phosphate isomerase/epimerase